MAVAVVCVSVRSAPETFFQNEETSGDDELQVDVNLAEVWHGRIAHNDNVYEKVDQFDCQRELQRAGDCSQRSSDWAALMRVARVVRAL